jgi:hypothetical protein
MVAEEEAPHLGGDMEDGRRVVEVFWSAISHKVTIVMTALFQDRSKCYLDSLSFHKLLTSVCFSNFCRAEDLRVPFERFGPVRDVYIPKDYYSG